jgi:predicted O-methyltransferase YrrM
MGSAGIRPPGDSHFKSAFEPWRGWGRHSPPGYMFLYTYWMDMKRDRDGNYWGNMLGPADDERVVLQRDKWYCLEHMIQANDPGKANGELAAWIDGKLYIHYTGIRWRTTPDVKLKRFGIGVYVHNATRDNKVWYDEVVLSTGYVGPLEGNRRVQAVIDEVDKTCREKTVYMIGPEKAKRLAELVREKKPKVVVECGTAIGYSGLWIARELKAAGRGKLITIEIDEDRSKQACEHFRRAGLEDIVDARVGDARKVVREIKEPVDFLFIDCNYSNYQPCLLGIEDQLTDGAVIVADNVGLGAYGMKDYLEHVRSKYNGKTEWFDIDLPWGKRDAMEITIVEKKGNE